jgi:LysR family pca operon transcriptional activator
LLERLRGGYVHVVLGRCPPLDDMSGLAFEQLYADRHIFVVRKGHPLATDAALVPTAIAEFPIVMPPRQSLFWQEIHQLFLARGVTPKAAQVEVLDLLFCRTLTLTSDAVWIVSERVVTSDLYASPTLEAPVGIITRRGGTLEPEVKRLIQRIHEANAS